MTRHVFTSSCPVLGSLVPAPKPSCDRFVRRALVLRTCPCCWRSVGRVASDVRTNLRNTQQQPRGRPTDQTRRWTQRKETHNQTAPKCSDAAVKDCYTASTEAEAETSRTTVICISLAPTHSIQHCNLSNHLAQRSSPIGSLVHVPDIIMGTWRSGPRQTAHWYIRQEQTMITTPPLF